MWQEFSHTRKGRLLIQYRMEWWSSEAEKREDGERLDNRFKVPVREQQVQMFC